MVHFVFVYKDVLRLAWIARQRRHGALAKPERPDSQSWSLGMNFLPTALFCTFVEVSQIRVGGKIGAPPEAGDSSGGLDSSSRGRENFRSVLVFNWESGTHISPRSAAAWAPIARCPRTTTREHLGTILLYS